MITLIFKMLFVMLRFIIEIIILPFKLIGILFSSSPQKKNDSFNKQANLWNLSKNDRRIAKNERMSPADYIEAEEKDDDNLDDDDF